MANLSILFEEWVWMPGYEGLYEISNHGKVRNAKTLKNLKVYKAKQAYGYIAIKIKLSVKGMDRKGIIVARAVATAFIPNPRNLPVANHLDGNPLNNRADNLEWCSYKENMIHCRRILKSNAGVTYRKIKSLFAENRHASLDEYVKILLKNCR